MKYFLRSLPTLLLVVFCFAAATPLPQVSLSESVRKAQLQELHRQLHELRKRIAGLENTPAPPSLPRGMGRP